jgi:hypothetical protein
MKELEMRVEELIFWTGWGILLLPVMIVCNLGIFFLWFNVFQLENEQPFIANLSFLLAFILGGIIARYLGKRLNKEPQVYIHKETGKEVKIGPRHTFFFIRLEHWGYVLPVLGIVIYVVSSVNS